MPDIRTQPTDSSSYCLMVLAAPRELAELAGWGREISKGAVRAESTVQSDSHVLCHSVLPTP